MSVPGADPALPCFCMVDGWGGCVLFRNLFQTENVVLLLAAYVNMV